MIVLGESFHAATISGEIRQKPKALERNKSEIEIKMFCHMRRWRRLATNFTSGEIFSISISFQIYFRLVFAFMRVFFCHHSVDKKSVHVINRLLRLITGIPFG